jgi:phage tail sheath protein FI
MSPKILIAPGFSSASSVQAALQVLAQKTKMRAVALVDAPSGAKMTQVLEGRGTSGTLELRLSDDRLFYCYPHLMAYDANTDSSAAVPFSPRLAGVIARTDSELGYWCSPSNKQILGVTGIETPLSASVSDATCDVNVLNGAGVVTVFTGYGVGIRTWGNRASTFPGSSAITTFMCVRRTIDMVDESIEKAALAYLDGPVGKVLIQAILDDVNAFLRTLISRGALMPGSRLEYFDADNEVSELAAGHVTFTKTYCPPPPLERLTYKSVLDTTLLGN